MAKIQKIEVVENQDVYDITTGKNHNFYANGILVHNCGEIALALLGGYCVIGDFVPYHAETLDEVLDAAKAITRALIRTNMMDSLYNLEVKRTNRIGVGMTGVHEFAWKFFKLGFRDLLCERDPETMKFWQFIKRIHDTVEETAIEYSQQLGLAIPHTMFTIKPSGTVSKLFNLTEGWHLPSMRYYLRWVQFRNDDPLIQQYKDAHYPVKELTQYQNVTIVGFPTAPLICTLGMGDKLVIASEATLEEQYEWIRLGEQYWIDGGDNNPKTSYGNQISYTLKYNPDVVDFEHFQMMLLQHQPTIKCCSVMPQIDTVSYEYQPEEPISKSRYTRLINLINGNTLVEDVDYEHVECGTGACPITFDKETLIT